MEDIEILDNIQGVMQEILSLRRGSRQTYFLDRFLKELPKKVRNKLTEISDEDVRLSSYFTSETDKKLAAIENLKKEEVLQQIIRAANKYRGPLGYPDLNEKGELPKEARI